MNAETKNLSRIAGAAGGTGVAVGADQDWLQIAGIVIAALSTLLPLLQKMFAKKDSGSGAGVPPVSSLLFLLASVLWLSGCAGVRPQSIETKAYAVTRLVSHKVLANNPDNPALRAGFETAAADLEILSQAELVDVPTLTEIVNRLPPGVLAKGDTALYVEFGLLFFSDELGQLAIENPEAARAAARGMARALRATLAAPPPQP